MRPLLAATLAWGLLAAPATASTLWGYDGLLTMPGAMAIHPREVEVGAHGLWLPGGAALTGYARYGLSEAWEASLAYGLPGHPWPTGAVRYALLPMVGPQGVGVALGAAMLGVPSRGPVSGTHLFVAVSRALGRWGTMHLGFQADLALNSRLMLGYESAIGPLHLVAEGFGSQPGSGPYANAQASFEPVSWLGVEAGSLGEPERPLTERGYYVGARARATLPEFWKPLPAPAATPVPRPSPTVAPASGAVSPPALPAATLVGRVLAPDGSPRSGYRVRVAGSQAAATTTPTGYFFLPGLALGPVELEVLEPGGRVISRTTFAVPATGPVNLTIQALRGERA